MAVCACNPSTEGLRLGYPLNLLASLPSQWWVSFWFCGRSCLRATRLFFYWQDLIEEDAWWWPTLTPTCTHIHMHTPHTHILHNQDTHTQTHTHIHTHTYYTTNTHKCVIHTCAHTHKYTHITQPTHTDKHIHMHLCTRISHNQHTYHTTNTHTNVYIHTCAYTHKHTYHITTHTQPVHPKWSFRLTTISIKS